MDDEYVQEHILTGGIVAPVGGGLADDAAAGNHQLSVGTATPDR
jgi:hypothetical protein